MQQQYQCPRCGIPVASGSRFCDNCGTQLNYPTQQQMTKTPPTYPQQQQQKMRIITGILVAVVIALVVLIVGFIPLKEVTNTGQEFLTYKVTGYTQEEQVDPQLRQMILSSVTFSKDTEAISEAMKQAYQKYIVAYVQVENTDKEEGAFPLAIIFYTPKGEDRKVFDIYLKPSEAKVVKYGIEAPNGEWSVKTLVIPDLKKVTTTEKLTLFEYLLSRF